MIVLTIWPIFAVICAGFAMARRGWPSAEFWAGAEKLNYFVLFPALLLSSLAKAPVRDPDLLRLGGAGVATILIAALLLAIWRRLHPMPAARYGPTMQAMVRFNTYLALAVAATFAGAQGVERAAVYLAVAVPLVNVLSILALTDTGAARRPRALLRTIVKNPLIIACVAGFVLALTGVRLPYGTGDFAALLGQGSLPLGLLCVGAALQPDAMRKDAAGLIGMGLLRLLGMPLVAALVGLGLGLDPVAALVLVVFSAVPTAPTAYVLTRQLGGDGPFMAGIVTSQTLLAVATIPLVLAVFGTP